MLHRHEKPGRDSKGIRVADVSVDYILKDDPKHLLFTLARYKFVSKCFAGFNNVLEIGCGNEFGSAVVKQTVVNLESTDIDSFDITKDVREGYDGVFCLDVIEHIDKSQCGEALFNLSSCAPVCIIGTPSLESQKYASQRSIEGHVNCMSGETLRAACHGYWKHVFMFSMNDEVLHTGFLPMSHYLIALCVE